MAENEHSISVYFEIVVVVSVSISLIANEREKKMFKILFNALVYKAE